MSNAYPVLIVVAVLSSLLGLVFSYAASKTKWKEKYATYSALLCFSTTFFVVLAMIIKSEKIAVSGWIIPSSLWLLLGALQTPFNFKKCTFAVTAECVSFWEHRGRGFTTFIPEFTYKYNGEEFTKNKSFVFYYKRKFFKLFKTGENYTIYIDPQNPKICADKRSFPYVSTIGLSLVSVCGVIMGVLCLFLMK